MTGAAAKAAALFLVRDVRCALAQQVIPMPRHELLNNVDHKDLRVILRYGAKFGDDIATVPTFPTEFADMQREYPIFFHKDPASGEYQAVALLGLEKGENLFVSGGRWHAYYLPGMVARGPFLIGVQEHRNEGDTRPDRLIHIDLDHPRVSRTEGEPIFLPQGGNTPFLDHVAMVLRGIHDGMRAGKPMYAAFAALDLIEPIKLEVKVTAEHTYNLTGLHTINHEKLRALGKDELFQLHQSGFLQGAYLQIASVNNIKKLIAMKQGRLLQAPGAPTGQ